MIGAFAPRAPEGRPVWQPIQNRFISTLPGSPHQVARALTAGTGMSAEAAKAGHSVCVSRPQTTTSLSSVK